MRIIAYDPSLSNLGFAYGRILDGVLIVEKCGTFQPEKFLKATGEFNCGDLTTDRQFAVEHFMNISLSQYKPSAIVGETSFYNGCNPSTIINQSKGLGLIERIARKYLLDIRSPFELVLYQPNVIKATLGLERDEFKDKLKINEHLNRRIAASEIVYVHDEHLPHNQLDHANDAVAMLYTLMIKMGLLDILK